MRIGVTNLVPTTDNLEVAEIESVAIVAGSFPAGVAALEVAALRARPLRLFSKIC